MAIQFKGINTNLRGVQRFPTTKSGARINMVRTVLDSYDPNLPNIPGQRMVGVRDLINYYDPYVRDFNNQGVMVLFVINQQTYGDDTPAPWVRNSPVSWEQYATNLGEHLRPVFEHFKARNVGFQIWNEPDVDLPPEVSSSVHLTAPQYALILKTVLRVMNESNVPSLRLGAGMAGGPGDQTAYWAKVVSEYGGVPALDGYATHLYTHYPETVPPRITATWTNTLRNAHAVLRSAIRLPMYWTELGVAADVPFSPKEYNAIAKYTQLTYAVAESLKIQGWVMWGYSDWERYGGIVDRYGAPKQPIFDTFNAIPIPNRPVVVSPPKPQGRAIKLQSNGRVNVRSGRGTLYPVIPPQGTSGTPLFVLDCAEGLACKVGNAKEWIAVNWSGQEAYVNGALVAWENPDEN